MLFRERSVLRRRHFRNVKVDTGNIRSVAENAVITTTLAIRLLSGELSRLEDRKTYYIDMTSLINPAGKPRFPAILIISATILAGFGTNEIRKQLALIIGHCRGV